MKKLFSLLLSIVLVLSLAACGANNTETPSNNTSAPPSLSPEETPPAAGADIGDGTGTYEGETDANGKFTGYGVWIYHNYRYEGYFVEGVPNGEGTLYEAKASGNDPEKSYAIRLVTKGNWVNGYADGTITQNWLLNVDHSSHTWSFDVVNGYSPNEQKVYDLETGVWDLTVKTDALFGVPPWADVDIETEIPAPAGEGANPTQPVQSQSPDIATTSPDDTSVSGVLDQFGLTEDDLRPESGMVAEIISQGSSDESAVLEFSNTPRSESYNFEEHYTRILNCISNVSDDGKAWSYALWQNPGGESHNNPIDVSYMTMRGEDKRTDIVYYYNGNQVWLKISWVTYTGPYGTRVVFHTEFELYEIE